MVGRFGNNKYEPIDLNGGFAAPDPRYDSWRPPADQIPVAGTGKDSRFTEGAFTKPLRPKRANLGAYATDWDTSDSGDATKPKPKPKLDGTGAWGDFGVKEPATSSPQQDKEKGGSYVEGSPVPLTIEGMNEVLKQRALAAHAKKVDQAASRTTSTASNNTLTAPSPSLKFVPPHRRKLLGSQVPPPTLKPAKVSQATSTTVSPGTEDSEDIVALCQKRLVNQQKQKQEATLLGSFTTSNAASTAQNNNGQKTVTQGELAHRSVSALPPKAIVARPEPGNHYVVPASWDERRQSSTTLVNEIDRDDDELMAKKLQAEEFGLDHAGHAHDMLIQELDHYKRAQQHETSEPAVGSNKVDLYEKLHKIQEILWKQETLQLHTFAKSKDTLYQMDKKEFQHYHASVVSAHLAQWGARRDRIEQILSLQWELVDVKNRYTVDELLAMHASDFKAIFDKIYSAHKHKASAVDVSSNSDRQYLLTEDDLNSIEDANEQEFDSDGFGLSGDEEEGDDDEEEGGDDDVVWKGYYRG